MKTPGVIKIFALPSHATKERTSGVDFARIIQPITHLNGYSDGEVRFETTIYDPNIEEMHSDPIEWLKVAQEYDVIYFNYLNNPWGFATMGAMARGNNCLLIMDLDDSLWNIKSDNPAHSAYFKGSEAIQDFTSICNEVDYITTTSDYLKHVIMNHTTKKASEILVFDNYIDLDLYDHRVKFKDTNQIQLTHFGSTTHFRDLEESEFVQGINRIMEEYPNVTLKMIGSFQPSWKKKWGKRYSDGYGNSDIYKWVKGRFKEFMDETDILIVPLTDDIYNNCKSAIKFLEASSAGIPGVYQEIRQYQDIVDHGANGFLAGSKQTWYKSIKVLIDDKQLRQNMGEAAYQTIVDNYQISTHIPEYAAFFKKILKEKGT